MKKIIWAVLALSILLLFSACNDQAELNGGLETELSPNPSESPVAGNVSPDTSVTPSASPSPSMTDDEAAEIYRSFLDENYDTLFYACFGNIAGVGFIDLDCDGCSELIIFDVGASASMGLQFFDIVDGSVECISANMELVGESFGGDHFTSKVVNANLMEDFRLMEDNTSGEEYFVVESGNGSVEFSYRELIRFGNDNGVLTLTSVAYKYEEYNTETNTTTLQKFRVHDADATADEYASAISSWSAGAKDLGLECRGVFTWESAGYAEGHKGFTAMVEKALELSANNKIS